ncbi:MAG: DRTGG domain-containing protein [Desulfobacterota bacterium]|nr:DRTGG domain-containing protein [Thermodesulfobacteriota bacterium]
MNRLIIASLRASAGKTSFIVGLAEALGKKIGYMKPFGDRLLYSKKRLWDYDAALMTQLYSIDENPDDMSIGFDHSKLRYMYDAATIERRLHELAERMGSGKDLLIVESGKSITYGTSIHLDALNMARILKGSLVFVISGDDDTILDDIMFVKRYVALTDVTVAGIVVNKVRAAEDFKATYLPELQEIGLPVLGVLPYDSELTYFTLRFLADRLFAKILTGEGHLDRIVKNIFIGAMSGNVAVQRPLFKKEDKLIITGGDRSDMIIAALNHNAAGIILTNNILPPANIIAKAEQEGVPMLLVAPDTYQVARQIDRLEPLLTRDATRKIEILKKSVADTIDISRLG